ncbi:hypothetical protein [Mycobacterium pseudoshottsii]|uniref:hypothetical protein n=1 Tax=Mycobacterium pseudoshottsii TaxID=265949 RepID=UPI00165DCC35|nr:hypothetical protein [Mycobacterium pseudoshottsii]
MWELQISTPRQGSPQIRTVLHSKDLNWLTGVRPAHTPQGRPQRVAKKKLLRRYLPRIVDQTNGINRAIKIMVENQRQVAKLHKTVGLDDQCVFIPRQQHHAGMVGNLDDTDISTTGSSFGFFDAGGFQYGQFGPLIAHGGFVVDQFTGTADPANPDNQTVSVRFVKVPPSWSQSNSS